MYNVYRIYCSGETFLSLLSNAQFILSIGYLYLYSQKIKKDFIIKKEFLIIFWK